MDNELAQPSQRLDRIWGWAVSLMKISPARQPTVQTPNLNRSQAWPAVPGCDIMGRLRSIRITYQPKDGTSVQQGPHVPAS